MSLIFIIAIKYWWRLITIVTAADNMLVPDTATVHIQRPVSMLYWHNTHQMFAAPFKQTYMIVVYVFKHRLMCCVHHAAVFGPFYSSTVANPSKRRFFLKVHKKLWSHRSQNQKLGTFVTTYKNRKPSNYTARFNVAGEENAKSLSNFTLHCCCVRFPHRGDWNSSTDRRRPWLSSVEGGYLHHCTTIPSGPALAAEEGWNQRSICWDLCSHVDGRTCWKTRSSPENLIFSSSGKLQIRYFHIRLGIKNFTS